ncbi:MAG: hypothetical protein HY291_08550 [Planctomycetes bacterium]|nr:hypothetical protein [Planctomycetota bacterium]
MSQGTEAPPAVPASNAAHHGLSDRFVTFAALGLLATICVISWLLAVRAAVPGALGAPLG